MHDPRAYLAAQILTEGNIVSYRTLSRYMGISSNESKKILQEFYRQEAFKKPGSIHAIYLIMGRQTINASGSSPRHSHDHDKDTDMGSSPFLSSSAPLEKETESEATCVVMSLVKEDQLEMVKTRYQYISSLHIHSLGPSKIQNLQLLAAGNRSVTLQYVVGNPLDEGRQYGIIQNARAKHMVRGRPEAVVPFPSATQIAKSPPSNSRKSNGMRSGKAQHSAQQSLSTNADPQPEEKAENESRNVKKGLKTASNKPLGIKGELSDIFKAFSHPKPKPSRENSDSSAQPACEVRGGQSVRETVLVDHTSELMASQEESSYHGDELTSDVGEKGDPEILVNQPMTDKRDLKKEKERHEQLRQMMEEGDEAVVDLPKPSGPASIDESLSKPQLPSSASSRRRKRKIMKKKMIKDEEGYLVTKEEPSWESFSEDEPPVPKATTTASTAATGKSRKMGGKQGQGNIMSFFGHK